MIGAERDKNDRDISGLTDCMGEHENLEPLNVLASKLDDLREYHKGCDIKNFRNYLGTEM